MQEKDKDNTREKDKLFKNICNIKKVSNGWERSGRKSEGTVKEMQARHKEMSSKENKSTEHQGQKKWIIKITKPAGAE